MAEPRRCPGCGDRRIQTYSHNISCWDDVPFEVNTWQCCGCGALLDPNTNRTDIVGYAAVVLPGGMRCAPTSYGDRRRRKTARIDAA